MLHVEVLCIVQFIIRSYDLLMQLRVFGKFALLTKILDHLEAEGKSKQLSARDVGADDEDRDGTRREGSRGGSGSGGSPTADLDRKLTTSTNRGCLYRICMDVEHYLIGMSGGGNGEDDSDVDPMEASTSPIRIWAEKHKVRWQSFVIGTLKGVEDKQQRFLAGLPIPCPDGINIIYDPGSPQGGAARGGGLSAALRGMCCTLQRDSCATLLLCGPCLSHLVHLSNTGLSLSGSVSESLNGDDENDDSDLGGGRMSWE